MGSLRVDTSVLDPLASKQNKSAYPTLANGMLIQANVPAPIMTHGPVTAGPDFGRHASARLDIVGQVCCGTSSGTNRTLTKLFFTAETSVASLHGRKR